MTLRFRFWYLYTSNAFIAWWIFHFRVKNCPKMCLKINRSVKTPWHRPSRLQVWELLAPGYGLLYEHVGGVTYWGGLSGLKCWNSDNLFDWIDFFKKNTFFFFWRKSERETKTANFLETRSFSLWRMLISLNQNAERARSVQEKERGRSLIAPFLHIDKVFFTELY